MGGNSFDPLKTQGRVVSGLGRGAQFLSIDWVRSELQSKLGFDAFPGTLNLKIAPEIWSALYSRRGSLLKITGPSSSACPGYLRKILLRTTGGLSSSAHLILPELTMYNDVLEIIAPENLREKLRLKDGDLVSIEET